jgi:hypothetical protein
MSNLGLLLDTPLAAYLDCMQWAVGTPPARTN